MANSKEKFFWNCTWSGSGWCEWFPQELKPLRREVPGVPDEARQKGKGEVMNPLFLPFCTRYVGI